MTPSNLQRLIPARIEYLKVQNFRALREVEFKDLKPMTVLLGPNGCGKSTVFDVFGFLSGASSWDYAVPGTSAGGPRNSRPEAQTDR